MNRLACLLGFCGALLLVNQAQAAEDAPLAPSCQPLVERIDQEMGRSSQYVQYSRDLSGFDQEILGVINIVPPRFLSGTVDERIACWLVLRGREPDATTMDAVFAASRVQLRHLNFLKGRNEQIYFSDLDEAFRIERATGVNGPISAYLRTQRLTPYIDDQEALRFSFDGTEFKDLPYINRLEGALVELAALCLAHPKNYRTFVRSLGFSDDLLSPHPSRLAPEEAGEADYRAYLDAERDRIVSDCPT